MSAGTTSLRLVPRADLDKDPHDIAAMFDGVARRYDLTNTVLTAGQDRRWRARTRDALDLRSGERVLDLAAGTAVSTVSLARSGAWCVAADFSLGMLRAGGPRRADGRGGRPRAALRRRRLRRGDDLVRPAQRRRPGHRARRAGPRHPTRGTAGGLRVPTPTWAPYRTAYHRRRAARPAGGRAGGVEQPRGLPLPRRVHPRLAGAARARRAHRGGGLDGRGLARPGRRRRRPAPRLAEARCQQG